jgi:hypothetical protein
MRPSAAALTAAMLMGATGQMQVDQSVRQPPIPWQAPRNRMRRGSGEPGATKKRRPMTASKRRMVKESRRRNRR